MMDKQLIDSFCEYQYPNATKKSVNNARLILQRIADFESQKGKDITVFSIEDFIELFNSNNWVSGYSDLYPNRKLLINYLDWLRNVQHERVKSRERLQEMALSDLDYSSKYDSSYFKSEDDFIESLTLALPDSSYIREKAICVMYWIGLSRAEVQSLKATDLDDTTYSIGRFENTSQKLYEIIKTCANAKCCYRKTSDGREYMYTLRDSEYVLKRLVKALNDKDDCDDSPIDDNITNGLMRVANARLSNLSLESKCHVANLRQSSLYNNGLFCRMDSLEQHGFDVCTCFDKQNMEQLKVLLQMKRLTLSQYSALRQNYMQWRDWKRVQ